VSEARPDPLRGLPAALRIDTEDRARRGIRISLPSATAPARSCPRVAAAEPLPGAALRALEYAVVDVETTGGPSGRGHRITEVCAVRLAADGRTVAEFATLLNPERAILPFVTSLTRITGAMVADAPRFGEIAAELAKVLEGAVFVAHNATFDWSFVSRELERAGGGPLRGRMLCTVHMARRLVPEVSSRSLDALTDYFGVHNPARHRAYGDARATAALFRRLLERLEEREVAHWEELQTLLQRRAPRRKRSASPHPMTER